VLKALILLSPLTGCTHFQTLEKTCGSGSNSGRCTDRMTVPDDQAPRFEKAGQLAIDALYSKEFETQLQDYMRKHANEEPIRKAWEGLTPEGIIAAVQARIPTLTLETYGGPLAGLKYLFAGNLAYDGQVNGPILVNRWGLPKRPPASIANTIVHEAAHKAAMTHPHAELRPAELSIAFCEPPYIVGSIVERIAAGPDWAWTAARHCAFLAPTAAVPPHTP
jgi:hypothetical protein